MNNFFRTIIAAYGAKKLGGGCFSTILIFFVIYWALGNCNSHSPQHASTKVPTHEVKFYNNIKENSSVMVLMLPGNHW